jgi:hypothetical protein
VQPTLLVFAQVNAEHVVLPIGEDAVSLFDLPNAEQDNLPHRRQRLGLQDIRSDHGTITLAQHGVETSCGWREFRTLLRLPHLIDGLSADPDGIAFAGLRKVQHLFRQVLAQR